MRAFAGTAGVAPFVALASNNTRSSKQQGNLMTVVAAAVSSSQFKENASYAKGKVQKVISLFINNSLLTSLSSPKEIPLI
jgi:L-serine deaminase